VIFPLYPLVIDAPHILETIDAARSLGEAKMDKLLLAIALALLALVARAAFADPGDGPTVTVVNPAANPARTGSVDCTVKQCSTIMP
jgi:hypothetical protein